MKKIVFWALIFVLWPGLIAAANRVDINMASLKELDTLIGVGPVIAQRIIDGRPYYSVDALLNVKGIGSQTLQDIKKQGLAYIDPTLKPPPPKPLPTLTPQVESLPKTEKSSSKVSVVTASVSTPAQNIFEGGTHQTTALQNPWLLFFMAIGIIVVAGTVAIIIKYIAYKNHVRS